jgi:dTDP-4-dehydrorhamnose reductase
MKILLTGAQGTLGGDIVRTFEEKGDKVIKTDKGTLDITNKDAVWRAVQEAKPNAIINAAAFNAVDKVEDPEFYDLAFAVNAMGPRNLAEAADAFSIPFVHYSSDYVFDGEKKEGYTEEDIPNPISKYGETKAEGERQVLGMKGNVYVCRLSKIFGKRGSSPEAKESFVHLMLRLAAEKPELNIVNEEVGSPGYTKDIAQATYKLLHEEYPHGVYHLFNDGPGITWYEFAQEVFDLAGVTTPYHPVPSSAFPRAATPPKFGALLNTKFPALQSRNSALEEFLKAEGLLKN